MTKTDREYLNLLQDIVDNGSDRLTRSGLVRSVFGRQMRFDLRESFPLLTTKKVFMKGVIHELLWFLQRPYNSHMSMNIEYLIRNGVHIWDDDAYRWFKTEIVPHYKGKIKDILVCVTDDEVGETKNPAYEYWIENDLRKNDEEWLESLTKEDFLYLTSERVELRGAFMSTYRFGDLGPIYGKQWRAFGGSYKDQIGEIINTLKTNPNDRRMLCLAFNPDQIDNMALPPCHVMMQFYTRKLTEDKYGLSCMFTMRSNDLPCGTPFNIASYGLLTHMIAHIVGMIPDELIYSVGDAHIYMNQMEGVQEQLSREGSDNLPQLKIRRTVSDINDFKFEDFEIVNYTPDAPIKFPLSVG